MLRKYAWNVSEEEYRDNNILSYSLLAKYEREGFECIPTLFEKVQTNSLSLGSALDIFYTDTNNFDKRVKLVYTDLDLSSKTVQIIFELFKEFNYEYLFEMKRLFKDKSDYICEKYLQDFYPNLKNETKIKKFIDDINLIELFDNLGKEMFDDGVILLNNKSWNILYSMINCVEQHPKINNILCGEDTDEVKRYFQLKFKTTINNREYRCMFDEIVVNNKIKTIYLFDLKTTYDKAYNFKQNFLKWRYDIQDRLYYTVLTQVLKGTEYESYTIKDMTNIVVSTTDLNPESNPLMFMFPNCNKRGDMEIDGKVLRDPLTIGEELYTILENNMQLPPSINRMNDNIIN